MGIRFKFLSGFLILCLMLLLAGGWSIIQMRELGRSLSQALEENYRSIAAGQGMIEALERQDSAVLLLILGRKDEGRAIVESAARSFSDHFEIAQGNITLPGEAERVRAVADSYGRFRDLWAAPIKDTSREGSLAWYSGEVHPAFRRVVDAVRSLVQLNDREMYTSAMVANQRAARAVTPGIVTVLAAVVFSLMFSSFVNFYVVNPLRSIIKGLGEFRESGKPFEYEAPTKDEIARLADAVRDLCAVSGQGKKT